MKNGWVPISACVILLLCGAPLFAQEFTILFTNSANGVIQNCYCPDTRLGGLEKRAQFLATYRRSNPDVLVVDNGDNFIEYLSPGFDEVITGAMEMMDYDVINLGDQDVAYATNEYLELPPVIENPGVPVTVSKGSVTFSILPILHPNATKFYPEFVFEDYNLEQIHEQIQNWLQSEGSGNAFRMLLSHSGFETDQALAATYPEIDLIVSGHSQTVLDTPAVVHGVPIVQAGGYAGYVGEITLREHSGSFEIVSYDLHPLTPEAPDHPEVLKLIDQHTSKP